MEPVPALFGLLCALAIGGAVRGGDKGAMYLASLCTAGWAISNIGWSNDALYLMPAFDLLVAMIALDMWRAGGLEWQRQFLWLAVAQIALHAINELTQSTYIVLYLHAINATFAMQLAVVGLAGGRGLYGFDLWDHFRHLGLAHNRSQKGR